MNTTDGQLPCGSEGEHDMQVDRIGDVLAKHFPVHANDTNELPNELRVLD